MKSVVVVFLAVVLSALPIESEGRPVGPHQRGPHRESSPQVYYYRYDYPFVYRDPYPFLTHDRYGRPNKHSRPRAGFYLEVAPGFSILFNSNHESRYSRPKHLQHRPRYYRHHRHPKYRRGY